MSLFNQRMQALLEDYETLVRKKQSLPGNNGWFQRYKPGAHSSSYASVLAIRPGSGSKSFPDGADRHE